jgi:hypothetical protein
MRFARFGVGGFKGCFDVGIVVGGEVYVSICGAKDAYSAYQQDLAQQQTQLQDLQAKLEADIGFIEQIDIDEMSELVGDLQADSFLMTNLISALL